MSILSYTDVGQMLTDVNMAGPSSDHNESLIHDEDVYLPPSSTQQDW